MNKNTIASSNIAIQEGCTRDKNEIEKGLVEVELEHFRIIELFDLQLVIFSFSI